MISLGGGVLYVYTVLRRDSVVGPGTPRPRYFLCRRDSVSPKVSAPHGCSFLRYNLAINFPNPTAVIASNCNATPRPQTTAPNAQYNSRRTILVTRGNFSSSMSGWGGFCGDGADSRSGFGVGLGERVKMDKGQRRLVLSGVGAGVRGESMEGGGGKDVEGIREAWERRQDDGEEVR